MSLRDGSIIASLAHMLIALAQELVPVFAAQGRLIRLSGGRETIFVGDTHGDRDATEQVLDRFLDPAHTIVFLGDTVDRGPDSRGNLALILEAKREQPDSVFLLMGNHEGWAVSRFSPADFWCGLSPEEESKLSGALAALPYVAWHPSGVLATHGGLPDVDSIDAIAQIEPGTLMWRDITWGDWTDGSREIAAGPPSRPMYDESAFIARMARLGARLLIRSHQPTAPRFLFHDCCLTLFSTSAYGRGDRWVAQLSPDEPPKTVRDLRLASV